MNCSKDYLTKELSDVEIQRRLRNLVNIISNDERIRNLDSKQNQLRINSHHHNLIEGNLCLRARNQPASAVSQSSKSHCSQSSGDPTIDKVHHPNDQINKMNSRTAKQVNYLNENGSALHNRHSPVVRLSGNHPGNRTTSGRQSTERFEDNNSDETVRCSNPTAAQQSRVTNCEASTALPAADETSGFDVTDAAIDAGEFDKNVNRIDSTKCHKCSNPTNQVSSSASKPANGRSNDCATSGAHFLAEEEDQSSDSFGDLVSCSESGDGWPKENANKFNKNAFLAASTARSIKVSKSRDDLAGISRRAAHIESYNGALSGSITNIGAASGAGTQTSPQTRSKLNEQRTSQPKQQLSGRIPPPRLVNSSGEIYIEHPGQNVVFSLYNSSIVRRPKVVNQLAATETQVLGSISDATERQFGNLIDRAYPSGSNEEAPTCARQPQGQKLDQTNASVPSERPTSELSHPIACYNEQMPVPNHPPSTASNNTRPPSDGEPQRSPDDKLATTGPGGCAQGGPQYDPQCQYQTANSSQNCGQHAKRPALERRNPNSEASCEQTSDVMHSNSARSSVKQQQQSTGRCAAASNLTASNRIASTAVSCTRTASDSCMQPAVNAAHVRGSSSETGKNIGAQASVSSHPTSARESCRSSKSSNSSSNVSSKLSAGSSVSPDRSASCSGFKSATLNGVHLKCSRSGGGVVKCAKCLSKCAKSQMLSNPDCQQSRLSPPNAGNMSAPLSIERLTCVDDELIVELENAGHHSPNCVQPSDSSVGRDVQHDIQPDDGQRDAQSDSPSGYHSDQQTYPNSDPEQNAKSPEPMSTDQQQQADESASARSKQLFINTNGLLHQNANGLTSHSHGLSSAANGLTSQLPPQQSPSATSSTASSLSLPVDMDSIDDGIHLNSVPEPKQSRDYRTHEEFVYAMKEDLAEWFNIMYDDLQLNVHNFMDQVGTGVIVCKHANNLILKAKQFYNEPDSAHGGSQHSSTVLNLSIDQTPQRRFSQCSAASSVSSNGSNNELSSLPINLNSYPDHSRSILDTSILEDSTDNAGLNGDDVSELSKRFNLSLPSSVSTNTLRPSLAGKSPQSSPKHQPNGQAPKQPPSSHGKSHRSQSYSTTPNGQLSKANSLSAASLLSPIRSSTASKFNRSLNQQQTPLIKKSIKPVQTNSEARPRTYSTSRIPQLNHPVKQLVTSTIKKSTNTRPRQSAAASQPGASTARPIPASPRRRSSLATSASSTNLINSSMNSSLNGSVRQQSSLITKSNLNSSFANASRRATGLTTNKILSQSSSSIYNQLTNYNRREKLSANETPKSRIVSKASSVSKANVPLSRTQSTSSGLTTKQSDSNQTPKQEPAHKLNGRGAEATSGHPNPITNNTSINTTISTTTSTHHQWYLHAHSERQAKLKHLSSADLIVYRDNIKSMKGMNEWYCRDNVANFITACRNLFKIQDCLLFETDDLVMRKNERSFILCMLEIARIGSVFGLAAPLIIQLEQEIDRELALEEQRQNGVTDCATSDYQSATAAVSSANAKDTDSAISSDCEPEEHSNEPPIQIVTNDLKSLHERVVELLNHCKCPSQFPMIQVADGKYRIGESRVLIFVRILRNHVMVRVGGGWDCLEHYLLRHDPCRSCRSGHKYASQAKVTISSNNLNNSFSSRKLSCDSINSLPYPSSNQASPNRSSYSKSNFSMSNKEENLSIMVTYNRCSTNVQG